MTMRSVPGVPPSPGRGQSVRCREKPNGRQPARDKEHRGGGHFDGNN